MKQNPSTIKEAQPLSGENVVTIESMSRALLELQATVADKFHLSQAQFAKIMNGDVRVARVVYERTGRALEHVKRMGIALLVIALACCLAIEGFADGVRGAIAGIFAGGR